MSRKPRPNAIDLDDIDITDAFECVALGTFDPNGSDPELHLLQVDPDGHIYDQNKALIKIFGHED